MKFAGSSLHFRLLPMGTLLIIFLFFCACAYHSGYSVVHPESPVAIASEADFISTSEGMENTKSAAENQKEDKNIPLVLSLNEAILMALENNASFRIDRLQPRITAMEEQVQRAVFDPTISASLEASISKDKSGGNRLLDTEVNTDSASASIGIDEFLPFGTTLNIGIGPEISSIDNSKETQTRELNWDADVTQSLLRGRGLSVNLARLRQARIDTEISIHELRGAAEALLAQTEQTVWEYILAKRSIAIYEKSLEVAGQQLEEVQERIRVGKLAQTEMAAVEAERANRLEQLINARASLVKKRLQLIQLLNPGPGNAVWEREVNIIDVPEMKPIQLGLIEPYVQSALHNRPDLNQARLDIKRGDIEIVRTKNGLLPKLDLFLQIAGSRYTDSFSNSNSADVDGDVTAIAAGLNLEIPYGNREAKARQDRAQFSLEQSRLALQNMEQLVQVDVRSAYVDVKRMEEQINATRATRNARKKTLNIEQEKLRLGKSTAFLVSQAQRDMVVSEIAEVEAIIEYRKALLNLYRLDGSLLNRKGIEVPE